MSMVLNLSDKTKASFRHVNGTAKVTFHGLDNLQVSFPDGQAVTLPLVEILYETLKQRKLNTKGQLIIQKGVTQ